MKYEDSNSQAGRDTNDGRNVSPKNQASSGAISQGNESDSGAASGRPATASTGASDPISQANLAAFYEDSDGSPSRRRPLPTRYFRIRDLCDYAHVSRQTIHNYNQLGLIRAAKLTQGGHRLYDESVFDRIDKISALKSRQHSLKQIVQQLGLAAERDGSPVAAG
jgi:hypothetical protein